MKRVLPFFLVFALCGCAAFVPQKIRESAIMDYTIVSVTVQRIDEGSLPEDSALEVLRGLIPSMAARTAYFQGVDIGELYRPKSP